MAVAPGCCGFSGPVPSATLDKRCWLQQQQKHNKTKSAVKSGFARIGMVKIGVCRVRACVLWVGMHPVEFAEELRRAGKPDPVDRW